MTDKVIENNQVIIMGKIVSDFTFSHEIFGEGFYMVDVEVARLSDSYDIIPLMVSERLLDVEEDYKGAYVCVSGQFRSYNRHEERKNRLILSVFAREIADVLLAVNRPYGKSDYIPCICWGRNARFAGGFNVGERCEVWGRIQSREYMKKVGEEQLEKRIAYEVSVSKLELIEE